MLIGSLPNPDMSKFPAHWPVHFKQSVSEAGASFAFSKYGFVRSISSLRVTTARSLSHSSSSQGLLPYLPLTSLCGQKTCWMLHHSYRPYHNLLFSLFQKPFGRFFIYFSFDCKMHHLYGGAGSSSRLWWEPREMLVLQLDGWVQVTKKVLSYFLAL